MREEEKALTTSIFSIRLQSDIILSLFFAYSKETATVTADIIALVIDYSTERSMEWLGM